MWKGVLAVPAGYVGMVLLVIATQPIIVRLFLLEAVPNRLTRSYVAANLSCAFVAAVVGGDATRLTSVPVQGGVPFSVGKPQFVFEGRYFKATGGRTYDVSADGLRFLMIEELTADTYRRLRS